MLATLLSFLSLFARKFTPSSIMSKERTFIAVKPDGVQRGLIGDIIKRFEAKGFKLAGMKFMQASEEHLKKHYADLSDKPFFSGLVKYMASGPLLAMCWEGTGIVKTARIMMGETRPIDSKPGTIRGDFCIEVGRNIIHGSDSVESAEKEINLWFKPEELVCWSQATHGWIYEFLEKIGDINSHNGLSSLNNYLEGRSYIQCYVPSKADLVLFSSLTKPIDSANYPHVFRWYRHINALCNELALDVNLYSFSNINKEQKSKDTDNQGKPLRKSNKKIEFSTGSSSKEIKSESNLDKNVSKPEINGNRFCSNVYNVLLEVKPKDEETDMNKLEEVVRGIYIDGLTWGSSRLSHSSYGLKKLSILCTVEDDRASIQDVLQKLIKYEDYISFVDIAAFNKL